MKITEASREFSREEVLQELEKSFIITKQEIESKWADYTIDKLNQSKYLSAIYFRYLIKEMFPDGCLNVEDEELKENVLGIELRIISYLEEAVRRKQYLN